MKMMKVLGILAACFAFTAAAPAAFLYDWDTDPAGTVQTLVDITGEVASDDSRDIAKIWYASDAGFHYFRIDLLDAPVQSAGAFSEETGIQIDLGPGGGEAADTSYVADGLVGIDTIILSHYAVSTGYVSHHRHNYLGDASAPPRVDTVLLTSIGGAVDTTENGGTTLQWSIPFSELATNGEFTIYGATEDISDPQTYDITEGLVVPEPMTLALLAAGGLALRRRRNQ